jgi:hypothetical protein
VGFAGVEADLHRRGAAHHAQALRPDGVEGDLHRLVARSLQQPGRRAMRVGAVKANDKSVLLEKGG